MWQEPSSEFTLISSASFSASSPLITTSNECIITRVLLYIYTHIIMMTTVIFIVVIFISNADHSTSFLLKKVCVCVRFHNAIMLSSLFHHRVVNGNLHCLLRCKKGEHNMHHFSLPKSCLLALTLHTLDLTLEDRFELLPVYRW